MNIKEYLDLHRFAIEKQFEIVHEYQDRLELSMRKAKQAEIVAQDRAIEYVAAEADPDEIHTQRDIWVRYQRMQEANQANIVLKERLQEVEQQMYGINQVCGLILQSAKQGISTVHSGNGWNLGRKVGNTEPLGNVILQARNQASHYEEGNPKPKVISCFNNLHSDFGIPNDLSRNLAQFVIFDVLGWKTYADYETDMTNNF